MKKQINVTRSSMPSFEEYTEKIRDLWDSRWLTNSGAKHQELEKELLHYLDVPYISFYSNGHLALETILHALHLKGGSDYDSLHICFYDTGYCPLWSDSCFL